MDKIILGKRGAIGRQTLGFGYILLLMVVGIGLITGAGIFFAKEIDFRKIEAKELVGKLMECISGGKMDMARLSIEGEIYSKCRIDRAVVEDKFVLEIKKDGKSIFKWGDTISCDFKGAEGAEFFPQCDKAAFILGGEKIEITAGSKQVIRRKI